MTPNNSPLADANVNVIEIDKKSGDVYIGTSAGVQIYKTDASIGNAFHDAKLVIYPNPVKPSYEGPIVIQGLAHESSVKIADVTGKLVFETQSLGSQAIWYGRDLNGNKVGTGVYTVFGTTTLNIDNPTEIIGFSDQLHHAILYAIVHHFYVVSCRGITHISGAWQVFVFCCNVI